MGREDRLLCNQLASKGLLVLRSKGGKKNLKGSFMKVWGEYVSGGNGDSKGKFLQ